MTARCYAIRSAARYWPGSNVRLSTLAVTRPYAAELRLVADCADGGATVHMIVDPGTCNSCFAVVAHVLRVRSAAPVVEECYPAQVRNVARLLRKFKREEREIEARAIQELGRTHPECVDPGDAAHPRMSRGLDLPTGAGIVGVREKQGGQSGH